jgi:hypothetical protein
MGRFDVSPQTLIEISPALAYAVAYMFSWGNSANWVSSAQGVDAALGGRGRY